VQKEKKMCRKRKKTPLNAFRYICSGEAAGEAVSADIPEDYYTTHRAKRQGEIRLKREKVSEKKGRGRQNEQRFT